MNQTETQLRYFTHHADQATAIISKVQREHLDYDAQMRRLQEVLLFGSKLASFRMSSYGHLLSAQVMSRFGPLMERIDSYLPGIQRELEFGNVALVDDPPPYPPYELSNPTASNRTSVSRQNSRGSSTPETEEAESYTPAEAKGRGDSTFKVAPSLAIFDLGSLVLILVRQDGNFEDAIAWYSRAISELHSRCDSLPSPESHCSILTSPSSFRRHSFSGDEARELLASAYSKRAAAHAAVGNQDAAVADAEVSASFIG